MHNRPRLSSSAVVSWSAVAVLPSSQPPTAFLIGGGVLVCGCVGVVLELSKRKRHGRKSVPCSAPSEVVITVRVVVCGVSLSALLCTVRGGYNGACGLGCFAVEYMPYS